MSYYLNDTTEFDRDLKFYPNDKAIEFILNGTQENEPMYRITEDSHYRITEDGHRRILE